MPLAFSRVTRATDLTSASRQRTLDCGGLKLDIQVSVMGSHPITPPLIVFHSVAYSANINPVPEHEDDWRLLLASPFSRQRYAQHRFDI